MSPFILVHTVHAFLWLCLENKLSRHLTQEQQTSSRFGLSSLTGTPGDQFHRQSIKYIVIKSEPTVVGLVLFYSNFTAEATDKDKTEHKYRTFE